MKAISRLILLLLISFPLYPDIPLKQLLDETGARLSWDSFSQKGNINRQGRQIRFQVGGPYALFDGAPQAQAPVIMRNHQLFLSETTYRAYSNYLLNREETQKSEYQVTVILLDPGHGGKDWGAYANYNVDGISTNLREKSINLDVALRVADLLRARFPDKEVALTRSDDRFVALTERVRIAESYEFSPQEGMVFVSIHTNASLNTRGNGFEVWYLPDDFDRNLAEAEGELQQVLNALWEEEFLRESYNLSRFILENMEKQTGGEMPNRGLKQNAWYMLRNQNMASCLIELAFLTNPEDARRLMDTGHLRRSAQAIADGIGDFIDYFEGQ